MHGQGRGATTTAKAGPDWRRLAPLLALGMVMVGSSAWSMAFLADRWRAQAPAREAAQQLRLKLEAEQRARDEAERASPVAVTPPGWETRTRVEPTDDRPLPKVIDMPVSFTVDPVEFVSEPEYRVNTADIAPAFRDSRISVTFRCHAGINGRLSGCSAREQPAGSGLGRVLLPKMSEVRVRPKRVNGEPTASDISFTLTFTMSAPRPAPAPAPAPTPTAPAPASGVAIEAPADGGPVTSQPASPPPAEAVSVEPAPAG